MQDPDVLDTWFSSSLIPFSVLGWPEETEDMKMFYPNSILETEVDILCPWVSKMLMMGIKLTGRIPFKKVYLHPMICDSRGSKMSKSKGNGIDPIDIINGKPINSLIKKNLENGNPYPQEVHQFESILRSKFPEGNILECGADALRFALLSYMGQSKNITLDIQRIHGYRIWCNKIWNAFKFTMSKLGEDYTPPTMLTPASMPLSCQWILTMLNSAIGKTLSSLEAYEFYDAASAVHSWWLYIFCDIFIEVVKPYFAARKSAQYT